MAVTEHNRCRDFREARLSAPQQRCRFARYSHLPARARLHCLPVSIVLGILILPMALVAEDVTTLSGKTYTNITAVKKYPTQVVFTYNGDRIPVAITNLPADFREKYGLTERVKNPVLQPASQTTLQSTNPTDVFLIQNSESNLKATRELKEDIVKNEAYVRSGTWTIVLTPLNCVFKGQISTFTMPNDIRDDPSEEIKLDLGQEILIEPVFNKFLEWEQVATTNKAEAFTKEITSWPDSSYIADGRRHFAFYWNRVALLTDSNGEVYSSITVHHFNQLAKLIPELKGELVQKIKNQEAQKELFK